MRPRQLAAQSPLLEAYGATQVSVSLGKTVDAILETPELGGRIASSFKIGMAQGSGMTDEQREQFRTEEAERRREISQIEWDLNHSTYDQVEREKLISRIDDLYSKTGAQRDAMTQQSIEAGRLMSQEAFKEKYGDLLEYTGPITPEAAELMYQGRKDEVIREAIIQSGPKGIVAGGVKLGASLWNIVTDPAELASSFIPVVGPARRAQLVARFGRVGGAAATGAIEGGVGNLLTEPLYYGLSKSQQLDYTMEDALFNVGAGVLLGGGIGTVAGALSRKSIDTRAVAEMTAPETRMIGGEAVEIPQMERISDEQIIANDRIARERAQRVSRAINGPKTMREAISQLATDRGVQVDLVMPRTMPRPQTVSEFVRSKGGINDADPTFRGELQQLGIAGRAQYFNSRGTQVNGISNPNTRTNLDDMAQSAYEEGFISQPDPNMLVEALREESRGNFVFSERDRQMAEEWRGFNQARNDYEAELAHRDNIRQELEAIGYKDATDDEIALISEYMATRGLDVEMAAERVAIQAADLISVENARRASRADLDPFADFEASMRASMTSEEIDFDAAIQRDIDIIQQMDRNGALTEDQRAILNEIEEIDARTDAYIRNLQVGINCIVRN